MPERRRTLVDHDLPHDPIVWAFLGEFPAAGLALGRLLESGDDRSHRGAPPSPVRSTPTGDAPGRLPGRDASPVEGR